VESKEAPEQHASFFVTRGNYCRRRRGGCVDHSVRPAALDLPKVRVLVTE
jgi:hypothetical protein